MWRGLVLTHCSVGYHNAVNHEIQSGSGRDTEGGRSGAGTYGRREGGEGDGFVEVEEGGRAGVEEADEVPCDDCGGRGGVSAREQQRSQATYALPRSTR